MTRERISRILKLREMLLAFQIGLNLVNAAVVCVILESISGLDRQAWNSRQIQLYIYFDLLDDAPGVVCHQLGLLGIDLRAVGCGGFVETLN